MYPRIRNLREDNDFTKSLLQIYFPSLMQIMQKLREERLP